MAWTASHAGYAYGSQNYESEVEPVYFKMPSDLDKRLVIVVDPMLATGNTAIAAVSRLKQVGAKTIKFLCLLTVPEGLSAFNDAHPDVPVFAAGYDEKLNEKGYIVPGIGDAGDRLFGTV